MMRNARKLWGLGAALTLAAATLLAMTTPAAASSSPTQVPNACSIPTRVDTLVGNFAGIIPAKGNCPAGSAVSAASAVNTSQPANGTPPLLFHGGQVMSTKQTGPLTIYPIYWSPVSHPMAFTYRALLNEYLTGVADASGQRTNVFSVLPEYYGTNGHVQYHFRVGGPIIDTFPLPASGCTVASTDTSGIYADGSGYNACLDDTQVQAEIDRVTSYYGLPDNLSHIYVMFLPKHVESCFFPGSTTTGANECTINYQPSAAYCAYHSEDPSGAVYANMPYPIYLSGTPFTCGTEMNFGQVESPNGFPDGDVQVSPLSHEMAEAITDPDTQTGWYDSSGFEIGDECAYVFGPVHGTPGRLYNQTIGSFHYLTQEEFSNRDFAITGNGCVQNVKQEA